MSYTPVTREEWNYIVSKCAGYAPAILGGEAWTRIDEGQKEISRQSEEIESLKRELASCASAMRNLLAIRTDTDSEGEPTASISTIVDAWQRLSDQMLKAELPITP